MFFLVEKDIFADVRIEIVVFFFGVSNGEGRFGDFFFMLFEFYTINICDFNN